jgi:GxxExxY protein
MIFDIHNEFGRFLDESLFKQEVAARCLESELCPVQREIRVRVTHADFAKDYFLDFLIGSGFLLELKTAETLAPVHRSQVLNYLFLTGLHHATLVNLRPQRVQREFVSTGLTVEKRKHFNVTNARWCDNSDSATWLKQTVIALANDWGAFLEVSLYREAVTHLLGGAEVVRKRVPVLSGDRCLGTQVMHLLDPETAFTFTAVTSNQAASESHQKRFLSHTRLKSLHWINFNHHQIEFVTLER